MLSLLLFICRFAKIDIDVSAPIVPFRETIVHPPMIDRVNELIEWDIARQQADSGAQQCKTVTMTTVGQQCLVHVRALPLPSNVVRLLVDHEHLTKTANRLSSAVTSADKSDILRFVSDHVATELRQFRSKLEREFAAAASTAAAADSEVWWRAVDRIWSFSRNGNNVLLNGVDGYDRPTLWGALEGPDWRSGATLREYDSAVVGGFHMATQNGPLCEEPMMGVCFVVEKWVFGETQQSAAACNSVPVVYEVNLVEIRHIFCRYKPNIMPF